MIQTQHKSRSREQNSYKARCPRARIIDMIDHHGISKENMLFLNRHGYFQRAPFAKSIPEFDVSFDDGRQLEPAELFKRPFPVELMGAGFDKPTNTKYFTLTISARAKDPW